MESYEEDWSGFDPMGKDFYEEMQNMYTNESGQNLIDEAPAPLKDEKVVRDPKQTKFPFFMVPKSSPYVTERMLMNFFGRAVIQNLEFRRSSNLYFVYFLNIGSLEAARLRVERYPNLIRCITGRHHMERDEPLKCTKPMKDLAPAFSPTERSPVNLDSREFPISAGRQKHPEFFRTPLVTKDDYHKGSLLAEKDTIRRYLSAKYEFALERHNVYNLKNETRISQVILHFRSGRTIPVSIASASEEVKAENLLEDGVTKCVACQNWTDTSCKLCKMPFCNASCLADVADQHKDSCGTGKLLKLDAKVGRKFPKTGLPPSGSKVKITAFEQTNVVYVRSADIHVDIAYYAILTEVMMLGKTAHKLQTKPVCGQIVLYKFETNISRAMVLNVNDDKDIYVVCIDFGSVEVTEMKNLYDCSPYLASLPCYPVAVQLRGVPGRFVGPSIREIIYEMDQTLVFVIKYSTREYDFSKGLQIVVMTENDSHSNLNHFLKAIMTPVEPSISELGYKEDCLPQVPLPAGMNIDIVVMDNSFLKYGFIYCTPRDLSYEVTKMQLDIQKYGEKIAKSETYAPPKNELCIAKYEGKWCRGLSLELVGDGYPSILFIDYGNIVPTHVTDIRPYPPQFIFPILTAELILIGLPVELTDNQIDGLEKYFSVGTPITCSEIIYSKEENNFSARFDKLQDILNLTRTNCHEK
ncbi:protein vreteno [Drosophila eugracilis]|uniref:protein vreteno n=1 Tax=Drosophila eugracilis TaxID=29029 RepID=UPI0007E5DABA|nr:protein vreteno [Drosophila eugracilis]